MAPPSNAATVTVVPTPPVFHEGQVVVSETTAINLNAPPSSPSWDTFEVNPFSQRVDEDGLYLADGLLVANGVIAATVPAGAEYSSCLQALDWQKLDGGLVGALIPNVSGVALNSLEEKPVTCLYLKSGRVATVARDFINRDRTTARLVVKVWERSV